MIPCIYGNGVRSCSYPALSRPCAVMSAHHPQCFTSCTASLSTRLGSTRPTQGTRYTRVNSLVSPTRYVTYPLPGTRHQRRSRKRSRQCSRGCGHLHCALPQHFGCLSIIYHRLTVASASKAIGTCWPASLSFGLVVTSLSFPTTTSDIPPSASGPSTRAITHSGTPHPSLLWPMNMLISV